MMANIRKQALLASGAQIEGLQQLSSNGAPKRVVYGSRKKKGPESKDTPAVAADSRPDSPQVPEDTVESDANGVKDEDGDGVKSDWDANTDSDESEAEPAVAEGVKDSWEASSGEEDEDEDEEAEVELKPAPSAPTLEGIPFVYL